MTETSPTRADDPAAPAVSSVEEARARLAAARRAWRLTVLGTLAVAGAAAVALLWWDPAMSFITALVGLGFARNAARKLRPALSQAEADLAAARAARP